jgi:hypothetical protein
MNTVVTAYLLGTISVHVLTTSFLHYRGDPQSSRRSVLVLPDANDFPASGCELLVSVFIAVLVLGYLRAPETRIELRGTQVIGATVPEAAVKEDGDLSSREDEIRSTAKPRDRTSVDTVAKPQGVNGRTKGPFRPSIPSSVCLHNSSDGLAGGPGILHSSTSLGTRPNPLRRGVRRQRQWRTLRQVRQAPRYPTAAFVLHADQLATSHREKS